MPIKIFRRGATWHYRGTVAGRRLRGTTGTANKETAARIAAGIEAREWKRNLDGPEAVLTFAQASMLYRAAGKSSRFLERIEDYWKDTLVKDMKAGAIRQSAIELYPNAVGATRNRQAIVPTQAVINFCADSELCPPIRVKRFPVSTKVRVHTTLEWIDRFREHASPHLGTMALFMFLTGARIGQAVRVQWDDIDFDKKQSLIRPSKTRKERIAHLPQPLIVALANLPRVGRKPVFQYKSPSSGYGAWLRCCERAGLRYISYHGTRHGFATALLHKKVDVVTVAKLGGWASPKQVFETYGHAQDDPTIPDIIFGTPLTQPVASSARKPRKIRST